MYTVNSYCSRCNQTRAFSGKLPEEFSGHDYVEIVLHCSGPRCGKEKFARLSREEYERLKKKS